MRSFNEVIDAAAEGFIADTSKYMREEIRALRESADELEKRHEAVIQASIDDARALCVASGMGDATPEAFADDDLTTAAPVMDGWFAHITADAVKAKVKARVAEGTIRSDPENSRSYGSAVIQAVHDLARSWVRELIGN